MAKRKKAQPWDAVFDRIQVRDRQRRPDCVYPAPITDTALNDLESHLDCRLPESYRAFMKRFGPGEIANLVYLVPLGLKDEGDYTLLEITRRRRRFFQSGIENAPPNAAWLGRLVYFGSDYRGDSYAWDPEDITSAGTHECRLYYLERMQERNPVAAGESLADLIRWTQGNENSEEEISPTVFEFVPAVLREKVKPDRSDVKLWLAFNNYAARDLVRSIRDRKQTDAFPVLADALQEAGCANADLLDSCRTGDPDIDGAWVLQVLLGKA